MVVRKIIKDYGGRKRINIVNDDNLEPGTPVVILTSDEYQELIDRQGGTSNSDGEADQMTKEMVTEIHQNYQRQLDNKDTIIKSKDDKIKSLRDDIDTLKDKYNDNIKRLIGMLSNYDKDIISQGSLGLVRCSTIQRISKNFNSKLWSNKDTLLIDAETSPGEKE